MRLSSGKPSRAAREFASDSRFSGNQSAGVRSANPVSPTTTVRCESVSASWVVAGRTGDCGAATQLCLAVGCPLSPFAENLVELTYGFASMSDQSVDKLPQRSGLQKVVGQSHIRLLGESLREGQWRRDRFRATGGRKVSDHEHRAKLEVFPTQSNEFLSSFLGKRIRLSRNAAVDRLSVLRQWVQLAVQ